MSVHIKMTALADEARTLSGTTDKKSIDEIIEDVTDANEEITDQSALISQILDAVNNLPEAKGDNCIDVTDITRGESDVIVDEGQVNVTGGYYPSRVVKTIESVEQAMPDITVFSTGQIIAKATQTEGYVYGGTKQASTQITHPDLVAENIKKDVTIFGVKGTFEGSGGGGGVDTCTVTINIINAPMADPQIYSTASSNGEIGCIEDYFRNSGGNNFTYTVQGAICGGLIMITDEGYMLPTDRYSIEGTAIMYSLTNFRILIVAPLVGGENCTITISPI